MVTQHALRIRLTEPLDVPAIARRLKAITSSRLWVEDVPAATAERRRAIELAREAAGTRCVLLRYDDGQADLVIVAPRDRPVDQLAAALLDMPIPAPRRVPPVNAVDAVAPDWGLGNARSVETSTHHHALPRDSDIDVDEAALRQALTVTLRHYDAVDDAGTAVGMLFDTGPDLPHAEYIPCLTPLFPLTISVSGRRLRCDFRLSHFSPAIVAQFVGHLTHVYQQLRRASSTDVTLMSDVECARIAALGRAPHPLRSTPTCLPDAFDRVAAATPDSVAVCDREVQLTYRELGERTSRLASGLRELGVGNGDKVVVCLDRTVELVVVLLGVLKAGAAYVPTDPAYPAERLSYTAQDARAGVVITRLPDFPCGAEARSVTPDELLDSAPAEFPDGSPDDPAYVIYTSGSTGRPKGVVVPHRNVISLIDATREDYRLGPDDVWTLFHSSAFDFSVWELWGCLLTGGRLVVVSHGDSREPERFRDLLVSERVTVLNQTPSAFAQLVDVEHSEVAVRLVVFGGEPLDARILLRWFDRHPESTCRVVNMFGITETTVHVTAQPLTRALALAATRSVGPPLPGWHVYVMDAAGRLAPPGVAGEIYVGGAGVALGYLNQPDLTAERFLPDPYAGGTMYRSGDLGRLLPDGTLQHLGRIDSQVKIRGFRIELDEIRSVLLEDADVRAAAAVVRHDDTADAATARIDAYVVPAGVDTVSVRKRVATVLPEYMVPATITALSTLPLTANGKLDATQLPMPAVPAGATHDGPPTDNDELARALQEMWGTVFGVAVGLDDDFYELGGNSLLAVRIGAAMRARGLPAPRLRDLFRTPTIRAVVSALATE
jgi:amino acid adenylation domain-containing protein